MSRLRSLAWIAASLMLALPPGSALHAGGPDSWPFVGGDPGNRRWSPLDEIDRSNVAQLEVAWTYRHGDFYDPGLQRGRHDRSGTAFEGSPLVVEGRLIFSTPYGRVIALDSSTGTELWIFDPKVDRERHYSNGYVTRGVAHWHDPEADGACASRILQATVDSRLIALDAATGKPCKAFGKEGTVDLHAGVKGLKRQEHHKMTSPPVVVGDVIVVGASLADMRPDQPAGDVRAFDARSGSALWTFHVIPRAGEPGVETWDQESWREGVGANPWAPLSADLKRGLVFVPTSTASPDYYGGRRPGDNLYADSLLALEAATGKLRWHHQLIHHDLWDYDLPAAPNVVRLNQNGREIDAVAQLTKTGFVFVFERETGKPVYAIEERPVPASDVPGERASPTQPFPVAPPQLITPSRITADDIADLSPKDRTACQALLASLRYEGLFTPPSLGGTLQYPGTAGGANWSGGAFDPGRGVLFVPINNFAMTVKVLPDPVGEAGPNGLPPLLKGRGGVFASGHRMCSKPPWGYLVAVDLNRGVIRWREPLGEDAGGQRGVFNLGSLLVTGGGLVFTGGTEDSVMRAFDSDTGKILANFPLPAGLHAGPITYRPSPEAPQFLVAAAGGHHNVGRLQQSSRLGDWIIAYTLPKPSEAGDAGSLQE
ncbi:pyrroloquinoline quinone-dependent dehydrogenase [Myxococcota bacterium]|nr:pyrroloquinoline quinone-dependent dehydrogenase [Myxococcota bacterium]